MDWIECHSFLSRTIKPGSVVLDLGANHAGFSTVIADRYGCRCIALEPTPRLHEGYEPHPLMTYVPAAASGTSGRARFWPMPCDQASTLVAQPEGESIEVECLTLRDLITRYQLDRIDLVKMDIEGAEIDFLDSASDEDLGRCDQLTIEFHDFNGLVDERDVRRVLDRLDSLGFIWARMCPNARGFHDTMIINADHLGLGRMERIYLKHIAKYHMAGPRVLRRRLGITG
ncbi:MAG: FkbM family methyltransferase [Phycisphaeraceae bacterium]